MIPKRASLVLLVLLMLIVFFMEGYKRYSVWLSNELDRETGHGQHILGAMLQADKLDITAKQYLAELKVETDGWEILKSDFNGGEISLAEPDIALKSAFAISGKYIVIYENGNVAYFSYGRSGSGHEMEWVHLELEEIVMSLRLYKLSNKGFPDPDEKNSLKFFFDSDNRGVVNRLVVKDVFPAYDICIDSENRLIDPWGDPYQYVLGNAEHYRDPAYREPNALPIDSNKPKDAHLPAAKSDWNTQNLPAYPYVYSFGGGDATTPETWIYLKE